MTRNNPILYPLLLRRLSERGFLLVSILSCAAIFGLFLGKREIGGVRERRLAGSVADMVHHDRWLLPHMGGQVRILKPLLPDWTSAVLVKVCGLNEWAFRLPHALCGVGTVLAGYYLGRGLLGRNAGRTVGLILATSMVFVDEARAASTDPFLTCFSSLAVMFWWLWQRAPAEGRRFWWGMYLCLGLGMLSKGPLVWLLFALPVATELIARRDRGLFRALRLGRGLALSLAVFLPWLFVIWWFVPHARELWIADMGLSLVADPHVRWYGYLAHFGNWAWFCFPWSLLGLGLFAIPWLRPAVPSPRWRMCYAWAVGGLLFFSTWGQHPLHYLLPLITPVAILEALLWRRLAAALLRRRSALARRALLVQTLSFVGLAGAVVVAAIHWHVLSAAASVAAGLGLGILALAGGTVLVRFRRPAGALTLFAVQTAAAVAIYYGTIDPVRSPGDGCKTLAREVDSRVPPGAAVYFHEPQTEPALPFYLEHDLIDLPRKTDLAKFLAEHPESYVLTPSASIERYGRTVIDREHCLYVARNHNKKSMNLILVRGRSAVCGGVVSLRGRVNGECGVQPRRGVRQ